MKSISLFAVLALTFLLSLWSHAAEPASTSKSLFKVETRLIEKRGFWNFFGQDKLIALPKVIVTEGTIARVSLIEQIAWGDMPPTELGIIITLNIKKSDQVLSLSGNVALKQKLGDTQKDQNGKAWMKTQSAETWFQTPLDSLPKTVDFNDVSNHDHNYELTLTITPVDRQGNPLSQ